MPIRTRTDEIIVIVLARWERHLLTILFLAAYLLVLVQVLWTMPIPGKPGWPCAVLLVLAAGTTVSALARHLPLQNILFVVILIGFAGGAVTWLDMKTGIPFGPFIIGDDLGPKLPVLTWKNITGNHPFTVVGNLGARLRHTVPWSLPVIWIVAVLNSRGVARLILRPWRKIHSFGFWLIGLTVCLTVIFDIALDPFASRAKHYWTWGPTKFPLSWQGAPLVNFFSWAIVALLILAFVSPLLIRKQPHKRLPPDFHPLGVWLGGVLLFGAGAASAGLWSAAALDGIIGVVVATFAIRGARW